MCYTFYRKNYRNIKYKLIYGEREKGLSCANDKRLQDYDNDVMIRLKTMFNYRN